MVKLFFASLDFEVTRPWVMTDDCCVTAYMAAELLLASPKARRSILKISSRYRQGFLELLLFQSAFFPSSPTRSLALWDDHSPKVLGRLMFLYTTSF